MGAGINEQFSDNPQFNLFGVVTGSVSCVQFPSGSAKLLRFKADPSNIGMFKLGAYGDAGGCLWPMDAGDDTGWFAPPSAEGNIMGLQNYTHSDVSGSADYLYYWLQR
jgi:hypothetical protein